MTVVPLSMVVLLISHNPLLGQIEMIRQGVAQVKVDLIPSANQDTSLNQGTYSKDVEPQTFPNDPTILTRLVTELSTQFYYFSWQPTR